MAESKKEMDDLYAMQYECNLVENPREWWMNFGATHHVCANKELFSTFAPAQGEEKIYMANSAIAKVEGIGKVYLKITSGKVLTLNSALYASELRKNLISVSFLDKNGFKYIFVLEKIILSEGEVAGHKDRSRDRDGDWKWKDDYKDKSDLYIPPGNHDVGFENSNGSVVFVVGDTVEPSQKKRGRPRISVVTKFVVDGNTGVAEPSQKKRGPPRKSVVDGICVTGATSSKNPSKKVSGRTSCSKKKQQQPEASGPAGGGSMDHIIHVDIGQDIVSKIMTFLEQDRSAICILSGVGFLCKVTLRRSETAGGTMTQEVSMSFSSKTFTLSTAFVLRQDQFDITSQSGSFIRSKSGVTDFFNLSVTSPDGSDFSGVVAGKLRAVTPVQVNLRCFNPYAEKPASKAPSSTPPPNLLNFGPQVTKAATSSQVPQPTFEGQAM
ncbi:hypothetical protein FXO38_04835 [Capsicum annuum]|nr:hypothetical protein FXO38_04835 [Capsicum annuum]